VAPFYFLFGIGMTLSFASQGAGRMTAPFFAGIARLIVATMARLVCRRPARLGA